MANMPGNSHATVKQPIVDHGTATNAGADCQKDDVAGTTPGTVAPFAKCRCNGVILDLCRKSRTL